MTTRRHPRTLNEAFPRTADYAASVERPMARADRIVLRASLLAACALAALIATGAIL